MAKSKNTKTAGFNILGRGTASSFNATPVDKIKRSLYSADGKYFGEVGFYAHEAITGGKLDSYTPKEDEADVINKFKSHRGFALMSDDGTALGNVSYDAYNAVQNFKLEDYLPKATKEEKEILNNFKKNTKVDFLGADGKSLGKISYEGYEYITSKGFDGYTAKNSEESNTIAAVKKQRSIPLVVEVDGKKKDFGKINYYELKYLNGDVGYTSLKDSEKSQALKDFEKYVAEQAKKEREPENWWKGILHGLGYTAEKVGAGVVGGIEDAGNFIGAAGAKLLTGLTPEGQARDDLNAFAKGRFEYETLGDMWSESAESRYRVPDWYRENFGVAAYNLGNMIPAMAAEYYSAGAAPTMDAMLAKSFYSSSTKAGVSSVAKSLSTKLITPKPSDAMFFLSAAGSSAKAGYAETGNLGQSLNYGVLNGIGEVATEKLFGGYGGTGIGVANANVSAVKSGSRILKPELADGLFDLSKIKGVSKLASTKYGKKVLDIALEGVEEVIMTDLEPWFRKATIDPNAKISNFTELQFWKDRGESFKSGVLLSVLSNASTYSGRKVVGAISDVKQRVQTVNALNKSAENLNGLLPSELQFEPLKYTASAKQIENRNSEINRVEKISAVNIASDGINAILKNEGDKLVPLKYDSTEAEIQQRQKEIDVFARAYADLMVDELTKNNPEIFAGVEKTSVGDQFIDTKTGYAVTVVDRDAKNTTVEINTGKATSTKVFSNNQADNFATNGQLVEVDNTATPEPTESAVSTPIAEDVTTKKTINLKRWGDNYEVYGEEAVALAGEIGAKTETTVVNGVETEVLRVPADKMVEASKTMEDEFNFVFSDRTTNENSPMEGKTEAVRTAVSEETSVVSETSPTEIPTVSEMSPVESSNKNEELNSLYEQRDELNSLVEEMQKQGVEQSEIDKTKELVDEIETEIARLEQEDLKSEILTNQSESATMKEKAKPNTESKTVEREDGNNERRRESVLPENGRRRNDGSARKQISRLSSFERRNQGKNEAERKSFTRGLIDRGQVENINDGKCEYTLVKPEAYNDDMSSMVKDAKSKGIELGFMVGNAKVLQIEGEGFYVDGIKFNSSKVIVRYDGGRPPQKIAKHEVVHAKWNTAEVQKAKNTILDSLTEEKKQEILSQERYARYKSEAYNGSEEIALEEFVCDVMAGMNKYTIDHIDTVDDYWNEDESADTYKVAEYTESTDAGGVGKFSFSSMGAAFFGDETISADEFNKMLEDGSYKEQPGYKKWLKDVVNVYTKSRGIKKLSESNIAGIEKQVEGIAKVAVASKKAGYDIYDDGKARSIKDSKKRLLFSSLEPNSDYVTSSDVATICDKAKNFTEIYDGIVKIEEERGVPADKRFFNNVDNYFILHKLLADKGLTIPCDECYVQALRKNLTPMANAFVELVTEENSDNKENAQLYHQDGKDKGNVKKNNAEIREKVRELLSQSDCPIKLEDLSLQMLTTADGLTELRLEAPLVYEAFNSFYGQSKPKMPKKATPFRPGELIAMFTNSKGEIKTSLVNKIKATGGFRLQSYSDFQIENYVDVLQTIFEASMVGLNGHAYTKVPAFLEATDGTNLKRNISIFMYEDNGDWKLDKKNSFPMELEDIYSLVASDKSGNTGIIAVSQNEDMSAWIMANELLGYGIPFHKSATRMDVVRGRVVKTPDGREILGYQNQKDHTKQQTEVYSKTLSDKQKENTKVKKPINIYSFWDFKNKDNLSKNELIEKNLKKYIDECNKRDYRPKFREYVMDNEAILDKVLYYAKRDGFVPQNATVDDVSFKYGDYTIPYGYHKFLGDFGMFTPDGKAVPIETLSLENYDFDKAVDFFKDSSKLRTNELLQQFENGKVRDEYRKKIEKGELTTEQLENILKEKRSAVIQKVVNGEARFSFSEESDTEYLELAKDPVKNEARLMELVDEKAVESGVDTDSNGNPIGLYHGTSDFGFTTVDTEYSDDKLTFWATSELGVAKSYNGHGFGFKVHEGVRQIGNPTEIVKKPRLDAQKDSATKIVETAAEVFPEYKDATVLTDKQKLKEAKKDIASAYKTAKKLMKSKELTEADAEFVGSFIDAVNEGTCEALTEACGAYEKIDAQRVNSWFDDDVSPYEERFQILTEKMEEIHDVVRPDYVLFDGDVVYTSYIAARYNAETGNSGVYKFYYKAEKPYVIDCKGENWNRIETPAEISPTGERMNTRQIARWAFENGYDSVKYVNAVDMGSKKVDSVSATVWAFMNPKEQLKSADPVTYDDNGNVIPLDERFNKKNDDVRWSMSEKAETEYAPTFYSHMGKTIDGMKQDKIGANSVVSYLTGRGVKAEEIKWSGIETFLDGKKSVTKAELQEFVANNQLQIEENIATESLTIDYTEQERDALETIGQDLAASWTEAEELWEDRFGEEMSWDIRYNDNAVSMVRRELRKRAGDNFDGLCEGIEKCIDNIERSESRQDYIVSRAKERMKESGLETRWGQYKLDGGENYREITFKMPNSDYTNAAMQTHWGDNAEGILAHARIQDFEVDGKKMLFIEEIQSDWHNEGHRRGYRQEGQKTEEDIRHADNDAYEEFWNSHVIQRISQELKETGYENDATVVANLWEGNTASTYAFLERLGITLTNDEKGYIEEQAYQSKERNKELKDAVSKYAPPDAPYRDNYHEYVLKHLIRMAAEQGYDSIGWTTADIQSDRWSDQYAEGYRIEYDQDIPKFLNKYGKKWGAKVGHISLNGGEITGMDKSKASFRWDMDVDAFGNEGIAEFVLQYDGEDTDVVYNEEQLMNEGVDTYYGDEILNYLWKQYSRGISGDVVWSMPITDSMKESVLYEGQPRYSFAEKNNLETQKKIESIAEDIGSHDELIDYAKKNTKEFVAKIKENKSLQTRLDNAKRQTSLSPTPVVNVTKAGNITKEILNEMESTLKATDLRDEVMSIYNEYFDAMKKAKNVKSKVQEANDNMLERFGRLAVDIVDSSVAYTESEEHELLKSYVKNTRINIPEDAKGEAHYAEFRKSHMGTFNLTNDGLPIDRAYQELCELFPGLFSEEVTAPADQLNAIAEALESTKPYAYNPHKSYMEDAREYVVYRFASEVDGLAVAPKTKAQKIAEKGAYDKNMALEKERTEFARKLDKHKEQTENTIRKLQKKIDDAKYVGYWEKRLSKEEKAQALKELRDKRDIANLKSKIRNIVSDMTKKLDKTEKNGGYPKELVKAAAEACSVLDFHTDKTGKGGAPTKVSLKLDALRNQYDALKNSPNYDYQTEHSVEISDKILKLNQKVGNKRVIDLTKTELTELYDLLSEIKHSLGTATKQIGKENAKENYEIFTAIVNDLEQIDNGVADSTKQIVTSWRLALEKGESLVINPNRIFKMIANYDEGSEFWKLYEGILQGERKRKKFHMEASMPFDELTSGGANEIAFYDFRTKTHKTGIKYTDGTEVEIPKSMICELVMLWDRNDGKKHLASGGVKIPNLKLFNKGKTKASMDVGKLTRPITQADITRLRGTLDSYDKAWIERAHYLFNVVGKDAINETSLPLVGRVIAKAKNYIRAYVDSDFVRKEISGNEENITLEGHGSLKETDPNAENPLVVRGLQENVFDHIDFVSKYYGLAIPIRNFNKVYKLSDVSNLGHRSIKSMLAKKFGSDIRDGVVVRTINELQRPRPKEVSWFNKVRGKWLSATFFANIASTLKQTTSYTTAASILGEDSLAKGLAGYVAHPKQTKAEIAKYSGTLYARAQGLSTTELGDRANRNRLAGASSKVTKAVNAVAPWLRNVPEGIRPENWLQSMDVNTSAALWEACKSEVAKTMKATDEGYMQAVADLWERVIEETQSNYDLLHRPEILKSTNELTKTVAMFQNDKLQQTGVLKEAVGNLKAKRKAYKSNSSEANKVAYDDAKKKMGKAVRSNVYSLLWMAVVSTLGDAILRKFKPYIDDEEKEITAGSVLEQMRSNMVEEAIGVIAPIAGDLFMRAKDTLTKGYDFVEEPSLDVIDSFLKTAANITKEFYKEDGDIWKAISGGLRDISNITGVPAKNLYDLFVSAKGYAGDIKAGEFAHDLTDYSGGKSFYNYGDLAAYIVSGDKEKEKKLLDYYSENGKEIAKGSLTQEIKPAYVQMYIDSPKEAYNLKRKLILEYDYSEETIGNWTIAEYFKHAIPGKKYDDDVISNPEYASEIASAVQGEKNWRDSYYSTIRSKYKTIYKKGEEADTEALKKALIQDFKIPANDIRTWESEADKALKKSAEEREAEKKKYK